MRVHLLMDGSGSMGPWLEDAREFGRDVLDDMFDTRWYQFAGPGHFQELATPEQKKSFWFNGGTDYYYALVNALNNVTQEDTRIVLVTDTSLIGPFTDLKIKDLTIRKQNGYPGVKIHVLILDGKHSNPAQVQALTELPFLDSVFVLGDDAGELDWHTIVTNLLGVEEVECAHCGGTGYAFVANQIA